MADDLLDLVIRYELSLHAFFFFNDTATTEIYTLSLHDALPIFEEAVSKLKGEGREERLQVTVNLGISLRIDESYIGEENQRLRMYKRIAGASSDTMLTEIRDELQDRYGQPPENVQHLLAVGEIRLISER